MRCYIISEKPLEGFHIVVDAGNGAGGFFAVSFLVLDTDILLPACTVREFYLMLI